MAKNLTVILEDRPSTLPDIGEVPGKAGINKMVCADFTVKVGFFSTLKI